MDAVVVATPDHAHAEPVRAALEAGKHVLCEKPFTTSLAEADALLALSRTAGVTLQVAFNHRWLPSYYHGFRAIRDGAIGRPIAGYARKNDTISRADRDADVGRPHEPDPFSRRARH